MGNSDISEALAGMVRGELSSKDFSSGSRGFYCQGKVSVDGQRYQASAQAILVGSKQDPGMQVRATAEEAIEALTGLIGAGVPEKDFQSGKTGYFTTGRVQAGGESYQAQVQAVLLSDQ